MIPTIRLRNRLLGVAGEIEDFEELKVILRFNGNDSWVLSGWSPTAGLDRDDITGIILNVDGINIMTGPIWSYGQSWGVSAGNSFNLGGSSDDMWMDTRVTLPVPAGPPYTDAAYDTVTTAAETMMHYYVNRNAGPGAKPERRIHALTMATDNGLGVTFTGAARFHTLTEILNAISVINLSKGSSELGWRIVQVGANLQFQVYSPTDLSGNIQFSAEFGNLEEFQFEDLGPLVNYAYVGGGGEGTARITVEGGDYPSIRRWGRVEQFVDQRQTSVIADLDARRDEALLEGKGSTKLSLTPIDTDQTQYLQDYNLGDRVKVVVGGIPMVDVIREVELTITSDGNVDVIPKVGSPDQRGPVGLLQQMRKMRKQIQNLERR